MNAIETTIAAPFDDAEASVREALSHEGFGVITEIDIAATLRTKANVDWRPMKILGACNPHLAYEALCTDASVAAVLPCNVVIEATEHGTHVFAVDPSELFAAPALGDLADVVALHLRRAIERVAGTAAVHEAPPEGTAAGCRGH